MLSGSVQAVQKAARVPAGTVWIQTVFIISRRLARALRYARKINPLVANILVGWLVHPPGGRQATPVGSKTARCSQRSAFDL